MNIKQSFISILLFAVTGLLFSSCTGNKNQSKSMEKAYGKGTFGYDLNYLSEKDEGLIVLKSEDGQAQIILSAKYQGKVFTSTAGGLGGMSHGFVNYDFFDSGVVDEHMNGVGGEYRFWLVPEGRQYSVYFEP